MKNKKTKLLLGTLLAFSLALSFGTFAKSKPVESVSAISLVCGEPEEDPVSSSEDPNDPTSSTPSTPQSSDPAESSEPAEEGEPKGESTTEAPQMPTFKEILEVLKNAFIDAWNDLVAHVKRWLKLS